MSNLRNKMKTMEEKGEGRRGEMTRKVKLLEEQVQYLERRLENCRQEGALKMSSIEGLLGSENGKLKTREKDLRRKLQREKETSKRQADRVIDLTAELKQSKDELRRKAVSHGGGWMKHVRLPASGEWPAIKLHAQQNKKALKHIFQQVEREGGPPVNLEPSIFLHCVILFLWWKREATVKTVEENVILSGSDQTNSETEELRSLNLVLQQRVKVLEDALGDCRVERQTFEATVSTNLSQLLTDKYELSNKVDRLEDTVSALHLDNNLLRSELNDRSASQQAKTQLDGLTAELQARLQVSESELRQAHLSKEKMEIDLRRASRRLQTLEQDAKIGDTVCKEHAERLANYDVRKAELEKTSSEFQAKVWSLQHDLESLEESRSALGKERDSFLGQLTKALEQLEDAREKIREQNYQLRHILDEKAQCTKTIKHQDEIMTNLQRDLTDHRAAQAKLTEEKEKRQSLEIISTNHERLVREMEERMRTEEVDSATLMAELCGAQTEERSRLEGRIEALEEERDEMGDVIETLSNDKATLRADTQRLKLDLDRLSTKLHTIVKRQALRVFQTPGPAARRPGESTDASTSTDPATRRSSPVGGEGYDEPKDRRIRDLEELIDLLVGIKGTSFSRLMLGGVDGDSLVDRKDVKVVSQRWEEMDETRMGGADDNEEDEDMSEHLSSGKIREGQRGVIAKLRALALMMRARQKLRGKLNFDGESKEDKAHHCSDVTSHAVEVLDDKAGPHRSTSHQDSYDLVDEPLVTKQEQQLLFSPVVPSDLEYITADVNARPKKDNFNNEVTDSAGEISQLWPAETGTGHSSEHGTEEQEQDRTSSESENEDLLSTLERERERLKVELSKIKENEARVQEDLQREQESLLSSLRRVTKYREECVRMQLEKEDLLEEPTFREGSLDDETNGMRPALDVELESMFLDELKSLKEENEMLMIERFQQRILDNQRESLETDLQEFETGVPSPRHPGVVEAPRQEKTIVVRGHPLALDDHGEGFETNVQELETETPIRRSQCESGANPFSQRKNNLVRGSSQIQQAASESTRDDITQSNLEGNKSHQPSPKDKIVSNQKQSLRGQLNSEAITNQRREEKPTRTSLEESRIAPLELQMTETEGVNNQVLASNQIVAELYSRQPTKNKPNESLFDNQPAVVAIYSSQQQNGSLLPEFEEPVHQTLVSREDVFIRSALDAFQRAGGQPPGDRQDIGEFDCLNGDDKVMVSSYSEPGEKPEADQGQELYILEAERPGERRHNQGDRSHQSSMTEQVNGERLNAPANQKVTESSQSFERELRSTRSANLPKSGASVRNRRDNQNALSKGYLQKQRPVEEFGAANETWEKAEAIGGSSTDFGRNAMSLQQDDNYKIQTLANKSTEIVWDTSKPEGLDGKKKVPQPRTDSDRTDTVTVASQEADSVEKGKQTTTSQSKQKGVRNLPKLGQMEERVLKSCPGYSQKLEEELSESQATLLKLHRGRQDLQDQLTAALQTEVRLQKAVDDLLAKSAFLQNSLNESADLVVAMQKEKDFLENSYSAAHEERRNLQGNLKKISESNRELEEQLQASKEHAELRKQEHKTLKKRFALETDRNAKLQRRVAELEKDGLHLVRNKQATMTGPESDTLSKQNREQPNKKIMRGQEESTMRLTDDNPKSERPLSEVILNFEENTELRNQLTKAEQVEFELQKEVDRLQEKAESLQLRLQRSTVLTAGLQQERDAIETNLIAANEDQSTQRRDRQKLETNLKAAQRKIHKLEQNLELLEMENESLRSSQTSSVGKHIKLQHEIESLRRGRLDSQSQPLMNAASVETSVEERKFRQREEQLKRQLEEQIDKTFDLENELDDSQATVEELERERNILQDDFTATLQVRSQLKTQLSKMEDQCQTLTRKLEDSRALVESLKQEMEGYLDQDTQVRDEEVRLLKTKLRELRIDRQHLSEKHADEKHRAKNLEAICKMHSRRQKMDEAEKLKLKAEMEELQREKQEITRKLIRNGAKEIQLTSDSTGAIKKGRKPVVETKTPLEREGAASAAQEDGSNMMTGVNASAVAAKDFKEESRRGKVALDVKEDEYIQEDWREMKVENFDRQYHDVEASEDSHKSLESAHADIMACSDRFQKLDESLGTSVAALQEELEAKTDNISRLRENTDTTLQQALTKSKAIVEESRREMTSVVERGVALRQKDTEVNAGIRLDETRKLLECSITEQRKQATSIAMLRQILEKALLQHSALKIRLRQQREKVSGALSRWKRERQSLKMQLAEHKKEITLSAKNNKGRPNIPQNYEETLKELKKENLQLSFDLRLANESLETRKNECWRLHESLQEAILRERELTSTVGQVQDQLKMEVEMQAQLAERSEGQEIEIFKLRSALGRQSVTAEGPSTSMNQEQSSKPARLNEMLTDFSREIQGHLESHMEKTQLQNDTDDRKKIQELECHLSNFDAQLSVDKITVQSLTDDNRRLRAMVYKLRERIANDKISHHKDSRMDAVYQALARAQVRVIATSMADSSQTILTGADVLSNTMTTGLAASRFAGRRHMGSAGNSLENSYD